MGSPRPSLRSFLLGAVLSTVALVLVGVAAQHAVFYRDLQAPPIRTGPTRTTPGEYKLVGIDSGEKRLERLFCRDDPADDAERLGEFNGWIPDGEPHCSKVQASLMVAPGTWLLTCQTGAIYCRYCAEFVGEWTDEGKVANSFNRRVGTKGRDDTAAARACRRHANDPTCQKWRAASGPREAVCSSPTKLLDALSRRAQP